MPLWWSLQPNVPPRTRFLRLGSFFLTAAAIGAAIDVGGLTVQTMRSVVQPPRSAIHEDPGAYGLTYENVSFPSTDGKLLRGWFVHGKSRAAVVYAHGHGGNRTGMLGPAVFATQVLGYSALLFDFRASGESDGEHATLGYHEWKDIAGAIKYLQTRPDVDPDRIGAWGASMGAAALLLMGEEARPLKAMVADSSFATGATLIKRFDRWFQLPAFPFALLVPLAVNLTVGVSPEGLSPVNSVPAISPTPLFLVHGDLDEGIPAADSLMLYQAAGEPKELWIAKASHAAAWVDAQEEYKERVTAFLRRYLGE